MPISVGSPERDKSPPNEKTDSSSESPSASTVRRWATEDDWERLRPKITLLYAQDNKTLSQLMSIMENEHDFRAT